MTGLTIDSRATGSRPRNVDDRKLEQVGFILCSIWGFLFISRYSERQRGRDTTVYVRTACEAVMNCGLTLLSRLTATLHHSGGSTGGGTILASSARTPPSTTHCREDVATTPFGSYYHILSNASFTAYFARFLGYTCEG